MHMRRLIAALALLASATGAQAEPGTLVIVGGGLDPANEEVVKAFLDARPEGAPGIAIIPAASGEPQASADSFAATLGRHGASAEDIVMVRLAMADDPATPDVDESKWKHNSSDPAEIARLEGAGAIWFTGGDQSRITEALLGKDGADTPMLAAIRRRLAEGAVVGGTSAGAAIMSAAMITQGDSLGALLPGEVGERLGLARGLGFLAGAIVDQHFGERARLGRLAVALTMPGQTQRIGLGIDEDTALVVHAATGTAHVAGSGYVTLLDARGANRSEGRRIGIEGLVVGLAGAGDSIDLGRASVAPGPFRKPTKGREYYRRPLPAGGGMAYGDQSLAAVIGEGLLDTEEAKEIERHSFTDREGVAYRFAENRLTRGWWGRDEQGRARYTIEGVAFDITPIIVDIRKAED